MICACAHGCPWPLALVSWPLSPVAAPAARQQVGVTILPALVRADPPSGAILRRAPRAVDLVFAAPLDPRRSTVLVVSDGMEVMNGGATVIGRHRDELHAALRTLPPGPYAVVWTAAAPGGAVVHRSYLFTVGPLGPPLVPDRPVSLARRVGGLTVTLRAPSDRVAHQTYTITVSAAGYPVNGARVDLTGRSLDMDMGETVATARAVAPGRYVAVADVVMAADWQVVVTIRYGRRVARAAFVYQAHY